MPSLALGHFVLQVHLSSQRGELGLPFTPCDSGEAVQGHVSACLSGTRVGVAGVLCLEEDVDDTGFGFVLKAPSHSFRRKYLHWTSYSVICLRAENKSGKVLAFKLRPKR